jgi:hypothetical protein
MCRSKYFKVVAAVALSAAMSMPLIAQDSGAKKQEKPAAGQPDESQMMAMMMEMAKPGENHKLLAHGIGTWTYAVKMWMNPDPNAAPMESTGTVVTREVMGGRYIVREHTGKMQMPGADGKMTDVEYKGMATEGYDNAKKKFVATYIDNMGTGIMSMEGTYDSGTKSLTYLGEYEMMPGMKMKARQVVKFKDNDHRLMEWYEDRGGKEVKTMEITYTRKT